MTQGSRPKGDDPKGEWDGTYNHGQMNKTQNDEPDNTSKKKTTKTQQDLEIDFYLKRLKAWDVDHGTRHDSSSTPPEQEA